MLSLRIDAYVAVARLLQLLAACKRLPLGFWILEAESTLVLAGNLLKVEFGPSSWRETS